MIDRLGSAHVAFIQRSQASASTPAKEADGSRSPAPGVEQGQGGQGLLASTNPTGRVNSLSASDSSRDQGKLPPEEEKQVKELKRRETEVRAHEAAHSAAGGSITGATSFDYTRGPDGKSYVTAGEVKIDASPVRDDPEATIRKMDAVIQAAHAPSDPSPQDLKVASQAQQTQAKAVAEAIGAAQEEKEGDGDEAGLQTRLLDAIKAYQEPEDETPQADLLI